MYIRVCVFVFLNAYWRCPCVCVDVCVWAYVWVFICADMGECGSADMCGMYLFVCMRGSGRVYVWVWMCMCMCACYLLTSFSHRF